ncbi:hypothetical protein VTN49DRAFT_2156 [Thermomyces lanuginosus]|uniref:uncharacterized protein n=1 Tax=Thermomyces lanuginosus TaxID=5541 RepID=UPI0037438573
MIARRAGSIVPSGPSLQNLSQYCCKMGSSVEVPIQWWACSPATGSGDIYWTRSPTPLARSSIVQKPRQLCTRSSLIDSSVAQSLAR